MMFPEWSGLTFFSSLIFGKKPCVIRVDIIWSNFRDVTRIPRRKREHLIGEKSMLVKYNNLAFSEFKTGCSIGFMPCFFAIIQVIPENKQCHRSSGPTMKQTDRPTDPWICWFGASPNRHAHSCQCWLPIVLAQESMGKVWHNQLEVLGVNWWTRRPYHEYQNTLWYTNQ